MKPTSTAVVACTFPRLEHRINRGLRHRANRGKRIDHALPVHHASADLCLLEKDFTEENGPRVVGQPPRQLALVVIVPGQQGLLSVVGEHASTSGFSGFSRGLGRSLGGFDLGVVGLDLLPNQLSHVLDFHFGTDGAQSVGDHG